LDEIHADRTDALINGSNQMCHAIDSTIKNIVGYWIATIITGTLELRTKRTMQCRGDFQWPVTPNIRRLHARDISFVSEGDTLIMSKESIDTNGTYLFEEQPAVFKCPILSPVLYPLIVYAPATSHPTEVIQCTTSIKHFPSDLRFSTRLKP